MLEQCEFYADHIKIYLCIQCDSSKLGALANMCNQNQDEMFLLARKMFTQNEHQLNYIMCYSL